MVCKSIAATEVNTNWFSHDVLLHQLKAVCNKVKCHVYIALRYLVTYFDRLFSIRMGLVDQVT